MLPYKYLLGILNSRLINYFYKQITQEKIEFLRKLNQLI
ncbi:MAG: hypothetical protein IPG00_10705 [Saprospiraceae bacterium]|nr:hypothetical protein [Saprospiraceae bacterium]